MPLTATQPQPARVQSAVLRGVAPPNRLRIEREIGRISDVSVASIGPCTGHPFSLDATSLRQITAAIGANGTVPVRLTHPAHGADPLLTLVGTISNARIVGDSVRADLQLLDAASNVPGQGDVREYILDLATETPQLIGLSAVIQYTIQMAGGVPLARITDVEAVDLTGQPASNRSGLLSSQSPSRTIRMNPQLKQFLSTNYGLDANATDEQAQAFYDTLSPEAKAKCEPAGASMSAVGLDATATAELTRVNSIRRMATIFPGGSIPAEVVNGAITAQLSTQAANKLFLAHLAETCKPITNVVVGADRQTIGLNEAVEQSIQMKMGLRVAEPTPRLAELAGRSLGGIVERWLGAHNIDARNMGSEKLIDLAIRPLSVPGIGSRVASLAQSSDSFPNLLANVASKSLRQAYHEAFRTWSLWARRALLPDFKAGKRIALSGAPGLLARQEGGEIKYSTISDSAETVQLGEYTIGVRLTRRAIVNDDLEGFGRNLMELSASARRVEDDVCYAVLTANAALSDTVALFHSTHANLDAATANVGAPSIATLGLGRLALRKQTGPKSQILNLVPRYLIVPAALESVAYQYTSTAFTPTQASNVTSFASGGPTPLTPVVEPRLDNDSAYKWYMAADSAQIDTVEMDFLESEPEPVLKQEEDFETDDVKFCVRHSVSAKAIDHRGLYRNNGA